MTVLQRTPTNTNLLQPTKYLLTFSRLPDTQFFCQSTNLPGLSLGQTLINSPGIDFYAPGNKLTYNNWSINFLVDEALQSWVNIHDWFRAIASPEGTDERNRLKSYQSDRKNFKEYSDATLTILSNLNNPTVRINFYNVFPVSLSDINFDTKLSAEDVLTADASFVYEYYNITKA